MLGKIQDELAKMIATALYDYGRKKGAEFKEALKNTDLRSGGSGLPPPLLVAYHDSFISAITARSEYGDGYTKWPHKGGEQRFALLLRAPLLRQIQKTDWVKAANKTADGVKQIDALGGVQAYQEAVSNLIGPIFDYTVAKYAGVIQRTASSFTSTSWALLSKVITAPAAPEGTTKFEGTQFIYWSSGREDVVATQLKLSRALLTSGMLLWKKPAPPSTGPYLFAR